MSNKICFFILTCARSGSTSLTTILNEANNGICAVEPSPNLNYETREMMKGRLENPNIIIDKYITPRVESALRDVNIYGEKNLTYGPFIKSLYEKFNCKFIYLKRDGREVVRSMMDWHNRMFGSIYRECKDIANIAPRALFSAGRLPVHLDMSDYSRPRPLKGEEYYDIWEDMKREEMCAYYWSKINDIYLSELKMIPCEQWVEIDYTKPTTEDILTVAEFCGLKGLNESIVNKMLNEKINSLKERCEESPQYPKWNMWDVGLKESFINIAGNTMKENGYNVSSEL